MTTKPTDVAAVRRLSALRSALAPIVPFLEDDRVIEVMLNADGRVWVERVGEAVLCTEVRMRTDEALRMLRMIAAEMGVELNAEKASLAAKLPHWGARVQAQIPPIVEAPIFAMRKPPKIIFSLDDYVEKGIIPERHALEIRNAIARRDNILVGGGTGTGKTTLLNALLQEISKTNDRCYIVEDNPELQCAAENKVMVLVQPPAYSCQHAIMDGLRLRPDRIIVGEVRDGSALELVKALGTGHPGGLGSLHASSTSGMLDRLCQLIEEVVYPAPRLLVAQTVNLCIHLSRDPKSSAGRRLTGLDQVKGLNPDGSWNLSPYV